MPPRQAPRRGPGSPEPGSASREVLDQAPERKLPARSEGQLQQWQRQGDLQVRTAWEFRTLVEQEGFAQAYARTHVVVAADAEFQHQASLHLGLGPTDPPMRLREAQLQGVQALPLGSGSELVLPIHGAGAGERQGGSQVLEALVEGRSVDFSGSGVGNRLQPRRELHTRLSLSRIGHGLLLLERAIGENGIVAVSSAEGCLATAYGPLLGPMASALYSSGGAGSIGATMPALALLGPGSPVLVGGAIGWVTGSGLGHAPAVRRLPSGHARTPGATAAVTVDLHNLQPGWLRAAHFEGHGSALVVPIAAPIPLLDSHIARQAAVADTDLEAPVLDLAIPRRLKPSLGSVSYAALKAGRLTLQEQRLSATPSHSPRLARAIAARLVEELQQGRFPLRLPIQPLSPRTTLLPLDP